MNDEANYAQDDPAYEAYITEAASLVDGLRHGDTRALVKLPENYAMALRERMDQRLRELDEGTIGQDEFDLEIRKMVSVACIGLSEAGDQS